MGNFNCATQLTLKSHIVKSILQEVVSKTQGRGQSGGLSCFRVTFSSRVRVTVNPNSIL